MKYFDNNLNNSLRITPQRELGKEEDATRFKACALSTESWTSSWPSFPISILF